MTRAPHWAWTSVCTRGSDASGPGRSGAPGRAESLPCCAPQLAPSIEDRGLKNRDHTAATQGAGVASEGPHPHVHRQGVRDTGPRSPGLQAVRAEAWLRVDTGPPGNSHFK